MEKCENKSLIIYLSTRKEPRGRRLETENFTSKRNIGTSHNKKVVTYLRGILALSFEILQL